MNPAPVQRIAPPSPTQVGPVLESLMDQYGVAQGFTISPKNGIRLPHYCDTCGRAEWDRALLAFRCPEHPRGATLGTAVPCRYWSAPAHCVVLDTDSGDVYYLR